MAINTKDYSSTKHKGIKIHKDKIGFLLNIVIDGTRYRKTFTSNATHTPSDRLKTAYEAREAFHDDKLHANTITANTDATVDDYWQLVKDAKSWNEYRVKKYNYFYGKHLSSLATKKIRDIKPTHFTSLNTQMKHLSPRTRLEGYEILKPIFEMAVEDEIIEKSPIKKSHIPKRKQLEEKKIVTDAEAKYRKVHEGIMTLFGSEQKIYINDKMTIACHDNPHHRAAFLFGFHGRRLAETLSIKWQDIDFTNMTYKIRGESSKVNTDMVFTLPADVAEGLSHFRETKGMVFNVDSVDSHYWKIRAITDIPEFSFHWMRNLSVSALAGLGASITDLSAMLGHTDSSTIRKYLSLQRESSTERMGGLAQKLLNK